MSAYTPRARFTTLAALVALMFTMQAPHAVTAGRRTDSTPANVPDAPTAPLDTPTTIVNEPVDEWIIYKGVIYWTHDCPVIPLRVSGPTAVSDAATLKRMPVGGGAQTTLATTSCVDFKHIAVDDSGVYYFDGAANKIKVVLTNRSTPVITDVVAASQTTLIRLDGPYVYFATTGQNIFRAPKTGGTTQAPVLVATDFFLNDFIFDAQSIYWLDQSGLWWAPKTCATLPCAGGQLSGGVHGTHMSFGRIAGGNGQPNSIAFVNSATNGAHVTDSIIELNCQTPNVCQLTQYYTAATDWLIGEFRFIGLPNPRFPILDTYLFWTEIDTHINSNTGHLLRRLADTTTTTPSELYPGTAGLKAHIDADTKGVYFSDATVMALPFSASAITRDLAAAGLEVTQAIQNMANDVGLVANKPTYVRAYGQQNSGPQAGGVEALLHGLRNGQELPGSPLVPTNGTVVLSTGAIFDRSRLNDGWLFQLPASWISEGVVTLRLEVDPRHHYADTVPDNNVLSQTVAFGSVPNLCLFFSPIRTENPLPAVGDPNFWETLDRFRRVWPVAGVNVNELSDPIEDLQLCSWHHIPYPCWGPYHLNRGLSWTNFPSDKDRVIIKLILRQAVARAESVLPGVCPVGPSLSGILSGASVHSVGLVHPEANTTDSDGTLLGYANLYFNASFYKMEPYDSMPASSGLPIWYWPQEASVMAQEITHNFNRGHIKCGTNSGLDNGWPYQDPCTLNDGGPANYFGFDVNSRTPIPPDIASDYMSYFPSRAEAPKWRGQWVSDYTYTAVKGQFAAQANAQANAQGVRTPQTPAAPALPQVGQMVYALGAVEPISALGHLDYAYAQPLGTMSTQARDVWQAVSAAHWQPAGGTRLQATGAVTYHLRLKDASNTVLDDRVVTPLQPDLHNGEHPAWPFLISFPAPSGNVTRIELLADESVLDTLTMGPASPAVTVLGPKAGDRVSNTLGIEWQASDPDAQDILHFNVDYSPDNGTTWLPLVQDYPGTPGAGTQVLSVPNPLALPGTTGAMALIRVTASDGYHTTSATSGAFSVAQRAPVAHVIAPDGTLSYPPNDSVPLRGGAIDAESGVLTGTALVWTVDGAPAGTGEDTSVRGLAPGARRVVLSATDPTNRTSLAQRTLHINPLVAHVGSTAPVLDGTCDDDAYMGASQIQLAPYADGSQATAFITLNGDKLWVCFTGLTRGSEPLTGRVGLDVDANFSQDGQRQIDDPGFFVGEDGAPLVIKGDGTPGDASVIDARVTATGTLWTAEMSINLASIGGAGHVTNVRLSHSSVSSAGDAFAWPYLAGADHPNTWGQTVLGNWPVLNAMLPLSATAGSGPVSVSLTGSAFDTGTVVLFDGSPLSTTVVSATLLSAVIPAAQLTLARTASVQVVGPGLSNAPSPASGVGFQVVNPKPVLTTLSPDTASEGNSTVSITITGSGFALGTQVLWDGQPLPTTIVSPTQVRTTIGAAQLQAGRVVDVTVRNAGPGGGPSNGLSFLVSSPRQMALPVVVR